MTRAASIRAAFAACALLSALFFPWPATAALALFGGAFEPLIPLFAGLFLDALYYPSEGLPLATLLGGLATLLAYAVRARLRTVHPRAARF